MNFQHAVITCFGKYVTFEGRAARSEYWYWVLFNFMVGMTLSMIDVAVFNAPDGLLSNVFILAALLPSIAVGVRRLHDLGKSGWWLLIGLIPLLGSLLLIFWFCQRGVAGDNPYGANPLGEASVSVDHTTPPSPPSQSQQL